MLCVTFGDSTLSNVEAVSLEADIRKCSSEEADARIVRHVINLGKNGYTDVLVKTVDSDVVILCIAYSELAISNGIINFLVLYGPKEKKIDVLDNNSKLGANVCKGLAFFDAFTDCVSSFFLQSWES